MARSLRETLAIDYAGGRLAWEPNGDESAADRVVASAWAGEKLGKLLGAIKYGGDRSTATLRTAYWLVVERCERVGRYGKQRPDAQLKEHVRVALAEWVSDVCPNCIAGWVRVTATPRQCPACNGVARLAWSDEQRAGEIAGTFDPKLYERILQRLQEADARHNNRTRKGLDP